MLSDMKYLKIEANLLFLRCVRANIAPIKEHCKTEVFTGLLSLFQDVHKSKEIESSIAEVFRDESFGIKIDEGDCIGSMLKKRLHSQGRLVSSFQLRSRLLKMVELKDIDEIGSKEATQKILDSRFQAITTKLVDVIEPKLKRLRSKQKTRIEKRLDEVADALNLSDVEKKVLMFAYIDKFKPGCFSIINYDDILDSEHVKEYLPMFLDVSQKEIAKIWNINGKLRRLKLIEISFGCHLSLADELFEYLLGSYPGSFVGNLFKRDAPTTMKIEQFNLSKEEKKILTGLLSQEKGKSINILFYGEPGTGKSSLASALANELKLQVLKIENPRDGDQNDRTRKLLCACEYAKQLDNAVIMVDEADRILCTRWSWFHFGDKSDKGWFNDFLEESGCRIIWITNSLYGIEDSAKRRFSFARKFDAFTKKQRLSVWSKLIMAEPKLARALTPKDIEEMTARYEINAGHIKNVIKQVSPLIDQSDLEPRLLLEQCLKSCKTLISGESDKSETYLPCQEHSLDGLNTDGNLPKIMDTLNEFSDYWTREQENMSIKNMNILLAGPPGTGKTEFAKYVASALKRDLIVKRASDLLSKWVGEAEKNIAEAFREASRNEAVLFIDEADSLLWNRESAVRSWEVTQTNEFLCQMENLRGILICATNRTETFDSAAIRRFNLKVNFDYLGEDGKVAFFERFFRRLLGDRMLSEIELKKLKKIPMLAPGDYKIVWQKNAFRKDILVDRLLEDLSEESEIKARREGRRVGF